MYRMTTMPLMTEYYDADNLKKLSNITHEDMVTIWNKIESDTHKGEETSIKLQTNLIRRLCRDAIKANNMNKVTYKHSKKMGTCGRKYAECPSLQNIKRGFRGLLSHSTAIDFDAICCHNTLLKYVCQKNNIPCDHLTSYINNREEKIKEFCEIDGVTSAQAKMLFIKSLDSCYKILKKDKKCNIKNQFFLLYDAEMKKIQDALTLIYPEEYKKIKRTESDNHNGKLLARIINQEEGIMLDKAHSALEDNYLPMTLVFDGIMIGKYDKSGKAVCEDDVITLLNQTTEDIGIRWDVKEPDLSLQQFADNLKSKVNVVLYDYTETELCKQIFNYFYEGKFYKRGGILYLLINNKWTTSENTIKDHVIRTVMDCHGYIEKTAKDGTTTFDLITQSMTGVVQIKNIIISIVPENSQFINDAEKRGLYNISFKNGYWDFRQMRFITYTDNPEYDTINKVERNFHYIPATHEKRKQLMDKIIYKMFCVDGTDTNDPHYKAMESFLHQMARAMCGIVSDKIWFNIQGERDSCKGVFDLLLRNAFGEYVGTFNSGSFKYEQNNNADEELKHKFLLKNRYSRIATSNESPGCWLDGNLIKKISSGGDMIDARNLFKDIETFQNVCKYMWLNNDACRIKPVDAVKTRWMYSMKCCFVDDPDNPVGGHLEGVVYYKRDNHVKDIFCNDEEVLNAFCSLLFDYFTEHKPFPPELRCDDEANSDPISEAKRIFQFGDEDDVLPNADIKQIYNDNKDSFDSLAHMKRIMKQLGAKDYRTQTTRGLRCVRVGSD